MLNGARVAECPGWLANMGHAALIDAYEIQEG
jgi:hypothetical protein